MGTLKKLKNSNLFNDKFLTVAAEKIGELIDKGYYDISNQINHQNNSLKEILVKDKIHYPIITEIKFSSPSLGKINDNLEGQREIVEIMEKSGASAISILTQPLYFEGSLENLSIVRKNTSLPILMKDIIIDKKQIDAGFRLGADVILLIETLFQKDENKLEELIRFARNKDLEILLEVNNIEEFKRASTRDIDILGINNRDLNTLELDMKTTNNILSEGFKNDIPIISESGICTSEDIKMIGKTGVNGFLIGTSIMKAKDIGQKVSELTRIEKWI